MFSKALALDLAPDGIRVNCVCPGITDTPMLRQHPNATPDPERTLHGGLAASRFRECCRRGRSPMPCLYLSGDRSSGITGASILSLAVIPPPRSGRTTEQIYFGVYSASTSSRNPRALDHSSDSAWASARVRTLASLSASHASVWSDRASPSANYAALPDPAAGLQTTRDGRPRRIRSV